MSGDRRRAPDARSGTQPLGAVPPPARTNGDQPARSGGRHARHAAPEPENRVTEPPTDVRKTPTHSAENPDSRGGGGGEPARAVPAVVRPVPNGRPALKAPEPISGPPAIPKPRPNPITAPKPINGHPNPLTWSDD